MIFLFIHHLSDFFLFVQETLKQRFSPCSVYDAFSSQNCSLSSLNVSIVHVCCRVDSQNRTMRDLIKFVKNDKASLTEIVSCLRQNQIIWRFEPELVWNSRKRESSIPCYWQWGWKNDWKGHIRFLVHIFHSCDKILSNPKIISLSFSISIIAPYLAPSITIHLYWMSRSWELTILVFSVCTV